MGENTFIHCLWCARELRDFIEDSVHIRFMHVGIYIGDCAMGLVLKNSNHNLDFDTLFTLNAILIKRIMRMLA